LPAQLWLNTASTNKYSPYFFLFQEEYKEYLASRDMEKCLFISKINLNKINDTADPKEDPEKFFIICGKNKRSTITFSKTI